MKVRRGREIGTRGVNRSNMRGSGCHGSGARRNDERGDMSGGAARGGRVVWKDWEKRARKG